MNMIVLDLEWNQSSTGSEPEVSVMPFEIIEIGAVMYGEDGKLISEFSELIKPRVYKKMHNFTSKLVHLQMEELEKGDTFENVSRRFVEWCGNDAVFVTWGYDDRRIMEQNIIIHDLDWDWIDDWINLQLIYNLQTDGDKN